MITSDNLKSNIIKKSLGNNIPQRPVQESHSSWLQDILPSALGITGSIAGGAVGTSIEPGGGTIAGSIAGGGAGQALGEWIRQFIKHQPLDVGQVAKEGATGAIFGAVPAAEGGGFFSRLAKRALTGGLVSGGAQTIQELGKKDSGSVERVAKKSVEGAVAFPLLGGALDTGTAALKFLGERIPEDIYSHIKNNTSEALRVLHETVQGTLVGHDNVEYALEKGIIPKASGMTSEVINTSLQKSRTKAKEVEDNLQEKLSESKTTIPISQIRDLIEEVKTSLPSFQRGNQLASRLYRVIGTEQLPEKIGKSGIEQINRGINVTVPLVNKMKRIIGEMYGSTGIPEIYNKFQTLVEQSSGDIEGVHALNQEAGKLVSITENLKNWKTKPTSLPVQLRPEQINKAAQEAASGNPKSLNALINIISLGGMGAIKPTSSALGGGTGGALGGMGVMFGLRATIKSLLDAALESPEAKTKVANALSDWYKTSSNVAEKAQIKEALLQLSARAIPIKK